ncbi:MAG: hypothetical protein ACP5LI_08015 [Hydrogenobaculum sp.]
MLSLALMFFVFEAICGYFIFSARGIVPKIVFATLTLMFSVVTFYAMTIPNVTIYAAYNITSSNTIIHVPAYNATATMSSTAQKTLYYMAYLNMFVAFAFWFLAIFLGFSQGGRKYEE